jgi:hypothetical protein
MGPSCSSRSGPFGLSITAASLRRPPVYRNSPPAAQEDVQKSLDTRLRHRELLLHDP